MINVSDLQDVFPQEYYWLIILFILVVITLFIQKYLFEEIDFVLTPILFTVVIALMVFLDILSFFYLAIAILISAIVIYLSYKGVLK